MVRQCGRAGKKELKGAGEEGFSILPRWSLCLFCCKVVAGLIWNCLSHELIQLEQHPGLQHGLEGCW